MDPMIATFSSNQRELMAVDWALKQFQTILSIKQIQDVLI
jgi:hypothetical protein